VASSAIDLSDGLIGDLGHVLQRSGVGARLQLDALPRSAVLAALPPALQQQCLLHGGDDYELLFSAAPERCDEVQAAARAAGVAVSRIGRIEAGSTLVVADAAGRRLDEDATGFDHFRAPS
jgi:thiamine-monophosphate kinase